MYYFAYGSNINQKQMRKRCPDSRLYGKGVLKDYKLDFTIYTPHRWNGGGCADIVAAQGEEVWGLLYEVSSEDIARLDQAEGPRYRRITKSILSKDRVIDACVYEVIDKAPPREPSEQYLRVIKNGAYENRFPETYIDFLLSIETVE